MLLLPAFSCSCCSRVCCVYVQCLYANPSQHQVLWSSYCCISISRSAHTSRPHFYLSITSRLTLLLLLCVCAVNFLLIKHTQSLCMSRGNHLMEKKESGVTFAFTFAFCFHYTWYLPSGKAFSFLLNCSNCTRKPGRKTMRRELYAQDSPLTSFAPSHVRRFGKSTYITHQSLFTRKEDFIQTAQPSVYGLPWGVHVLIAERLLHIACIASYEHPFTDIYACLSLGSCCHF